MGWKPSRVERNQMRGNITRQMTRAAAKGQDLKKYQDALDDLGYENDEQPMGGKKGSGRAKKGVHVSFFDSVVAVFTIIGYILLIAGAAFLLVLLWL